MQHYVSLAAVIVVLGWIKTIHVIPRGAPRAHRFSIEVGFNLLLALLLVR